MKLLPVAIALTIAPVCGKDQVIKPRVGPAFGEVFVAEVEFVDKRNSYIEQNLLKEPWLARVIRVNGVKLEEPIVIEYVLVGGSVTKGKKYTLKPYEDLYKMGTPRGWTKEIAQIDYHLRHRLYLQPDDGNGKKGRQGGARKKGP